MTAARKRGDTASSTTVSSRPWSWSC